MASKKAFRYLVITTEHKLFAIKSSMPLDCNNEKQMQWLSRECDNENILIISEAM